MDKQLWVTDYPYLGEQYQQSPTVLISENWIYEII
jgi:hypothetical protein